MWGGSDSRGACNGDFVMVWFCLRQSMIVSGYEININKALVNECSDSGMVEGSDSEYYGNRVRNVVVIIVGDVTEVKLVVMEP